MIGEPPNFSFHTMATDQEIETIISEGDSFCPTPKILFTSPIEDITRDVIECGESGVPCVITGFPLVGDERSPFRQSREWMESVYANRGVSIPDFSPMLSLKPCSSQRCGNQRPQH